MRERQRSKLLTPVTCGPGDRLICRVRDHTTGEWHTFAEKLGRKMVIDTVVTFDLDGPALGLKDGIGAVFGQEA